MDITKFKPLFDGILVHLKEIENKTTGGLVMPETVNLKKYSTGIVIALGNGIYNDKSKLIPISLKIGDIIFFDKYAGHAITDEYRLIKESVVWGLMKNDN